jgi:hypothetical protein
MSSTTSGPTNRPPQTFLRSAYDMNGLIDIQQQYATDLTQLENNDSNDESAYIDDLNTRSGNLYNSLQNSQVSSQNLIVNQDLVNSILNTENTRLANKKQNIDNAVVAQNRLIQLNDSYRKRQAAYINIMIVIIIAIVLLIAIRFINMTFSFIPESIFYIIYVSLITLTIMYVGFLLNNIRIRDKMNYDELLLNPPTIINPTPSGIGKVGINVNSTSTPINNSSCVGEDCCGIGSTWNTTNKKCQYEKFTNMDSGDDTENNSPYEFHSYAPV